MTSETRNAKFFEDEPMYRLTCNRGTDRVVAPLRPNQVNLISLAANLSERSSTQLAKIAACRNVQLLIGLQMHHGRPNSRGFSAAEAAEFNFIRN